MCECTDLGRTEILVCLRRQTLKMNLTWISSVACSTSNAFIYIQLTQSSSLVIYFCMGYTFGFLSFFKKKSSQLAEQISKLPFKLTLSFIRFFFLKWGQTSVHYLSFRSLGDLFLLNGFGPPFLVLDYQLVYKGGHIWFQYHLLFGAEIFHNIFSTEDTRYV